MDNLTVAGRNNNLVGFFSKLIHFLLANAKKYSILNDNFSSISSTFSAKLPRDGCQWSQVNIEPRNDLMASGNMPFPDPIKTQIYVAVWCLVSNTNCTTDLSSSTQYQSLYLLSGQTSDRNISWKLEAARLVFKLFQSLWNFAGSAAAETPFIFRNDAIIITSNFSA